ncbi:MAG: PaaI family thioesterase [Pirellulaceae bacterium]|nr:PaaI family thioesterase [Pirellulaceae bacterium]
MNDPFATFCGVEIVEARPGYAQTRLVLDGKHRNAVDLTHGGALFTLGAAAFFAACNAAGPTAVGINLSIAFLRPVADGILVAEATETARSRRIAHCEVSIMDESGQLVARLTGTAAIREPRAFPAGLS